MSSKEAKQRVQLWKDEPGLLLEDLQKVMQWVEQQTQPAKLPANAENSSDCQIGIENGQEGLELIEPVHTALGIYCRQVPHSPLKYDLLQPLIEGITAGLETWQPVSVKGIEDIQETIKRLTQLTVRQEKHRTEAGRRSDMLSATIEEMPDELIIRTDKDGSVKLRGSTHIPMFLAFWNAPKHKLSEDNFLDIDRSVRLTNLIRHRNRLSGILQGILMEITEEKGFMQLQRTK